ncbi:MAG TPA: sodium:proton antiporter [Thermoanaerobaculia bacterium]|nr:sodium:proton antiporter [Thermoanaerobaculia bacterium]
MSFLGWMSLAGVLLLLMALSFAHLRRLPVSTSAVYLAIGAALGPLGFGLLRIDIAASVGWFERVTEIAVIVSLFVGGLRLRLPVLDPAWRAAYILAGPVMLLSIVGVALFANLVLGFPPALALLIGAILAPTDPVLASAISVNDAADEDRLRYGISAEAGLNDGMAFPFVVFALLWGEHDGLGPWAGEWALHRLVWAIPAGLLLGFFLGRGIGRFAIFIRSRNRDRTAPSDFLALALIAISYVAAEAIGAWGFLSVFAAGVGLRGAEIKVVRDRPHPEHSRRVEESADDAETPHPPAEDLVSSRVEEKDMDEPAVAAGVLLGEVISFGDTAERLLEVLLVVIVGVAIAEYWSVAAIPLALALLFIIRPLVTLICLIGSPTTMVQRSLMGWFGIRGIGSLYYLSYALSHRPGQYVEAAIPVTITVIALSVLLHGLSSQPILGRYERALENRPGAAQA